MKTDAGRVVRWVALAAAALGLLVAAFLAFSPAFDVLGAEPIVAEQREPVQQGEPKPVEPTNDGAADDSAVAAAGVAALAASVLRKARRPERSGDRGPARLHPGRGPPLR
ncbi:hypothetical protein ACFVAJ_21010 [Agromyces sp. NPDC057679]|uniref:hypothetical protein n=1 Tax=Agromyces sp. NPDC057679 TaxID=3346207 RepID=UPI0036708321